MQNTKDPQYLDEQVLYARALRLIFGRVAFIFLLLVANLW